METDKAAELVMVIFAKMNKIERKALVKLLKSMKPKLDFNYPNGIPEAPASATDSLILPK